MNLKRNKSELTVLVLAVLLAITVIFIFSNSFNNGEVSNYRSSKIAELVRPVLDKLFGKKTDANFVVRKCAHLLEFALLGFIAFTLVRVLTEYTGKKFMFCCLFGTLSVAVIDEYIQSFTGRTSLVSDILIDFAGALIGMTVAFLLYLVIRKVWRKY